MKLLVLANLDMGLYKFRKELMETLCSKNEVIVATPHGEYYDALQKLGCEMVDFEFNRRGMNPLSDTGQLFRYVKLIRSEHPDLVLTYTVKPNVYGGMACQLTHTPYLANVTGLGTSIENGGVLGKLTVFLYRLGLRKANCVFFQNSANLGLFAKRKVVGENRRLVSGSGVNIQVHQYEPYPDEGNGIRFLFVGRIMKDKGVEELFEALRIIHKRHSEVSADIVGFCDEDYSAQLKRCEREGFLRFHGTQDNVHAFYANAHCTVLPSYHEGTANVMLESASTGRPVITTRVPGCKETFDEGVTGFGCEAKSVDSLVEAMEKFLSLSHEEKERMGHAGREKMIREYDRQKVIDAYLEEIEKVMVKK